MAVQAISIISKLKELHAQVEALQESFGFLQDTLVDGKLKVDLPNGAAYRLAKALSTQAAKLLSSLDAEVVDVLLNNDEWEENII